MYEYAVNKFSCTLASAPYSFKTQKRCENAVIKELTEDTTNLWKTGW